MNPTQTKRIKKSRSKGVFLWMLLAGLLLLGGFVLLLPEEKEEKNEEIQEKHALSAPLPSVEVVSPQRRDITPWTYASGVVRARRTLGLTFRVPGTVKRLGTGDDTMSLRIGDTVRGPSPEGAEGQLLAALDSRRYEALLQERRGELDEIRGAIREARQELQQANIELGLAARQAERMTQLHKEKAVPSTQFEQARGDHHKSIAVTEGIKARIQSLRAREQTALARLQQAKLDLEDAAIYAPFDGVIMHKNIHLGSVVQGSESSSAEEAAFFLLDPESIEVVGELPVFRARGLRQGQKVLLRSRTAKDRTVEGTIRSISPLLTEQRCNCRLYIELPKRQHPFFFGENIAVHIGGTPHKDVLTLPKEALITQGEKRYCYVLDQNDQTVTLRQVETGVEENEYVAINEGVTAEDLVVLRGKASLGNGTRVQPISIRTQGEYACER